MVEIDGDAFAMKSISEVSWEVQVVRLHQPEMDMPIGKRHGQRMGRFLRLLHNSW